MASRSSRETELSSAIVNAVNRLGCKVERINSGIARPMRGRGIMHLASAGTPDLLVLWPYLWIETKDLAKLSPEQTEWHAWAKRTGVPVIVAHSVNDAVQAVMERRRA
jgi:hypothetical protein